MDYFWRRSIVDCSMVCQSADEQPENPDNDAQCKQIGEGCLKPQSDGITYMKECGVYVDPTQIKSDEIDYGPNVESCPTDYDFLLNVYSFGDCFKKAVPNKNEQIFGKPSSVTTTLSSIGVKRFNMSVTWEHPDAENQTSLNGYRVTVQRVNSMGATDIGCLCVRNITQRQIDIPYMRLLQYGFNAEDYLRVTVSTFPRPRNRDFHHGHYSKQYRTKWPENCLMINHTERDCSAPQYEEPTNVQTVLTLFRSKNESHPYSNTKQLDISWNPPRNTSDLYVTPSIYYITLFVTNTSSPNDVIERIYFQTNNTHSVSIYGLNSSDDFGYILQIQAYKECTGIKYFSENKFDARPCSKSELIRDLYPTTKYTQPPTYTTSTTIVGSPSVKPHSEADVAAIVPAVIAVVVTILIAGFVVYLWNWKKPCRLPCHNPLSPVPPPLPPYCYVVVIYPLDTPLNEKIFIQSMLCPLQDYVDNVVFIDNHSCGTGVVALSWEEELRKATIVLFACTPKFCTDWVSHGDDGSQNSQLFNFLKATLATDIVNNQAEKYAAVVFNKSQKIPNRNFLSSIKRVVVDGENIDDIQFFVTKVPNIVCTDVSNGIHNEITHHRLVSSPNQDDYMKRYDYTESSTSLSKEDESCSNTDEECSQYSNQYIA